MSVNTIWPSRNSEYPFVCPASPPPGYLIERRLLPKSLFCDEELSDTLWSSDVACDLFGDDFSESDESASMTYVDYTSQVIEEEDPSN